MIEVTNLHKTFRVHEKEAGLAASVRSLFVRTWVEKRALVDVSLRVEAGEIVGLLGANGAGKTTLVKVLSGIIHPTRGRVRVLGHDPWQRSDELRSRMALIMGQKAQLWWDLPAADCFLLLREIYRIPPAQYRENLAFLAEMLRVTEQLKIQIRRLSLGERMKMELIAALLHNPRVVYLDEPTIGLDLTAQRAIREFILEYRSRLSPAMIVTSHYMEDIKRLCKRIVILRRGSVVYDGDLATVAARHARRRVIVARLRDNGTRGESPPANLGEVLEMSGELIRLKTDRATLPAATAWVLAHHEVEDLSIEDEDISTIIEALLRDG